MIGFTRSSITIFETVNKMNKEISDRLINDFVLFNGIPKYEAETMFGNVMAGLTEIAVVANSDKTSVHRWYEERMKQEMKSNG